MTQSVFVHLSTMLTATTNEPTFPDLADNGRWLGNLPVLVSGAAFGAASATEGLIALVHGPSIAVADSGVASVDISTEAALEMSDTPSGGATQLVSLYGEGLSAARVTVYKNWMPRRLNAIAVVRGVNV